MEVIDGEYNYKGSPFKVLGGNSFTMVRRNGKWTTNWKSSGLSKETTDDYINNKYDKFVLDGSWVLKDYTDATISMDPEINQFYIVPDRMVVAPGLKKYLERSINHERVKLKAPYKDMFIVELASLHTIIE